MTHLKFSHSRRDIMPRRTATAPAPAGRKGAMRARANLQRALSATPLVARPRRVARVPLFNAHSSDWRQREARGGESLRSSARVSELQTAARCRLLWRG